MACNRLSSLSNVRGRDWKSRWPAYKRLSSGVVAHHVVGPRVQILLDEINVTSTPVVHPDRLVSQAFLKFNCSIIAIPVFCFNCPVMATPSGSDNLHHFNRIMKSCHVITVHPIKSRTKNRMSTVDLYLQLPGSVLLCGSTRPAVP